MSYDINVDYGTLSAATTTILNSLDAIEKALNDADAAAEAAIQGFGGTGNPVADEMANSIQKPDLEEFAKVKTSITNLATDLGHVQKNYSQQEEYLLNALKQAVNQVNGDK